MLNGYRLVGVNNSSYYTRYFISIDHLGPHFDMLLINVCMCVYNSLLEGLFDVLLVGYSFVLKRINVRCVNHTSYVTFNLVIYILLTAWFNFIKNVLIKVLTCVCCEIKLYKSCQK